MLTLWIDPAYVQWVAYLRFKCQFASGFPLRQHGYNYKALVRSDNVCFSHRMTHIVLVFLHKKNFKPIILIPNCGCGFRKQLINVKIRVIGAVLLKKLSCLFRNVCDNFTKYFSRPNITTLIKLLARQKSLKYRLFLYPSVGQYSKHNFGRGFEIPQLIFVIIGESQNNLFYCHSPVLERTVLFFGMREIY